MKIILNGSPNVTAASNVQELLIEQKLEGKPVIVERNKKAIVPSQHSSEVLSDGDEIELFMLGAGG